MKPAVNDQCIACGACIAICPEVFEFDGEGKSTVIKMEDYTPFTEKIEQSKNACPVQAISIKD